MNHTVGLEGLAIDQVTVEMGQIHEHFTLLFTAEENGALPKDEEFWYFLFNEASKWGLEVYEQDWLDIQYRLAR